MFGQTFLGSVSAMTYWKHHFGLVSSITEASCMWCVHTVPEGLVSAGTPYAVGAEFQISEDGNQLWRHL